MKIIGISGRKQSGKNTVANYINGDILSHHGMIKEFKINHDGQLEIKTSNSQGVVGWGIFDVTRKDADFINYAEKAIWPYVKVYHFADYLKKICIDLFDLTHDQVYGSDDDKNTMTNYDMTAREFLQYFGTNVMRKIKDAIWVDYTIKNIIAENSLVALVPDVRFPNEIDAIHKAGGIVVRLTRDTYASEHECEAALDEDKFHWDKFDLVVDNKNTSIEELTQLLSIHFNLWR